MRGVEARRHDTVSWIRDAQAEMLALLAKAQNAREYREVLAEEVFALARSKLEELRRGRVPPQMLAIRHRLSRAPEEYRVNLPVALAAREMARRGVQLAPGESIEFVLARGGGALPLEDWNSGDRRRIDVPRYRELFLRMLESLAAPAGFDRAAILVAMGGWKQEEQALPLPGSIF
jgi:DNA polymerase elongation subunit (family B)